MKLINRGMLDNNITTDEMNALRSLEIATLIMEVELTKGLLVLKNFHGKRRLEEGYLEEYVSKFQILHKTLSGKRSKACV